MAKTGDIKLAIDKARRRVKELEAELKAVKAASALFEQENPVDPKGSSRLSEG